MKRSFAYALALGISALFIGLAANAGTEQYEMKRRLQLTEPQPETAVAVWTPDSDFFRHVDDLAADWRAYTPNGREVVWQVCALPSTDLAEERSGQNQRPLPLIRQTLHSGKSLYAFATEKFPVDRLTITTTSDNFERRFRVLGSDNAELWRPLGEGRFSKGAGNDNLSATFDVQRHPFLQLEIENDDRNELQNLQFHWSGPTYRIYFYNAPPALHLYYGGDTELPDYPLPAESPSELATGEYPAYLAGTPESNAQYRRPEPETRRKALYRVYLLLFCGGSATLLLLAIALKHLKKKAQQE